MFGRKPKYVVQPERRKSVTINCPYCQMALEIRMLRAGESFMQHIKRCGQEFRNSSAEWQTEVI